MPQSLFENLRAQRFEPPPLRRIKPNGFARFARGCWNAAPWVIAFWFLVTVASIYAAWQFYENPDFSKRAIPLPILAEQDLSQKFPGLENLQTMVLANGNAAMLEEQRADLVATLRQQTDTFDLVFAPGFGDYYDAHGLLYHPLAEVKARVAYALSLKPLFSAIAEAPNANSMATLVNEVSASIAQGREPQGLEDLFTQSAASLQALMTGVDTPVDWSIVADIDNDSTATQAIVLAIPKPNAASQARVISLKLLDVIKSSSTTTVNFQQAENTETSQSLLKLDAPRALAAGLIGLVFAGLVLALALGRLRLAIVCALPVACVAAFTSAALLKVCGQAWMTYWPLLALVLLTAAHISIRYAANVIVASNVQTARESSIMSAAQNHGRGLLWIMVLALCAGVALLALQDPKLNLLAAVTFVAIIAGLFCVISLSPALFRVFPDAAKWRAGDWLVPAHQALFETGPWQFMAKALVGLGACASLFVIFTTAPLQPLAAQDGPVNILVNSKVKAEEVIQNLKSVKAAQSVRWLTMFLPEDAEAKRLHLVELKDQFPRIDPVASQAPQDLRDQIDTLSQSLKDISATPETKPTLKKAADDFRRSLALLGATSGDEQVRQLENRLFGGFNRLADRADVLANTNVPTLESLPEELRKLFMTADGEFRLEILPAPGVSNRNLALSLNAADFDVIHPVLVQKETTDGRLRVVLLLLGMVVISSALLLMFRFGATPNLTGAGLAFAAAICILTGAERLWQTEWNLQWLLVGIAVLANLAMTLIKTPMAKASTALSAIEVFLIPAVALSLILPFMLLNVDAIANEVLPMALALGLSAAVVGLWQQHGTSRDLLKVDDYGIDG
jgi:uncharacterized protein